MYAVIRLECSESSPLCARVLSTHRSLQDAQGAQRRVQSLVERSRAFAVPGLRHDDIQVLCTAGLPELGREISARLLQPRAVASTADRPA